MKIEALPLPSRDNVPVMFSALIQRIQSSASTSKFVEELDRARLQQSILAKTELGRWAGVLDKCDEILEWATKIEDDGRMIVDYEPEAKKAVVSILKFTALLFESTSTRRIYSSMERLLTLLDSSDLAIVADVLRLLQTIGKRSKFLPTSLSPPEQTLLVDKLTAIAQCWGGKLRTMKMVGTLSEETSIPTVFPFQYSDGKEHNIFLEKIEDSEPLLAVVDRLTADLEPVHRYAVLARIRMIRHLHLPEHRMHCLIIRLLSISTLIYCRCHYDENQINALVHPGFVDETAALLKVPLEKHYLVDAIQAESLRTLTAIVSLDKTPKVNEILDGLGANSYHGFIANFTRMLVSEIKIGGLGKPGKPSIPLATALFSFIYHVSNNEAGGEKLMSCGLTQTLLSVIEHKDLPMDLLSFATRCCRIIDTFTGIDSSGFRTLKGMNIFLDRIVHEVNECRKDQPFIIDTADDTEEKQGSYIVTRTPVIDKRCHQLRVGLIKGLLTFVKRVINVPELQEAVRHIMDGTFPDALIHIVSNAEYYSDSIYHHTLQLITNFIYQEPAQLSLLQSKHLPFVMLQSMLRKELPNSKDVISNLGNVFTALCLNEAGLKQFKSYNPFEHVFKVLLSIKFLATIKKKRAEMNDSAANMGAALDDLLRHQPTLKQSMLTALLTTLDMLNKTAAEPAPNTRIVMAISKTSSRNAINYHLSLTQPVADAQQSADGVADGYADGFSPRDDDSDDDEEADLSMDEVSSVGKVPEDKMGLEMECPSEAGDGSRIIPLGDYIIIYTKVFEQIVTQANCQEITEGFVKEGGIEKLLDLSQTSAIRTELAISGFSSSTATILQFLLACKEAGKRLMDKLNALFVERLSKLLSEVGDEPRNGSYLLSSSLSIEALGESLSFISSLIPMLSYLTKLNNGPSQYTLERKARVHDTWISNSGKLFHQRLRRMSRYLSWEATLIRMVREIPPLPELIPVTKKAEDQAGSSNDVVLPVDVIDAHNDNEERDKAVERRKTAIATAKIPDSTVKGWNDEEQLATYVVNNNKYLQEFLNLLARSCYNPLRRNRRYEYNTYTQPKQSALLIEEIFTAIYHELKYKPKEMADTPMEYYRIGEVLSQLQGVLFDDRRQAYHPMLDKFYSTGLHKAFCDVLTERLAPGLQNGGCEELRETFNQWMKMADRLANRQKIVQTIYKHYPASAFDPETYIRLVQSDFFRVLSELFATLSLPSVNLKAYQRLCEEAISVFKEVARGFVPNKFEAVSAVDAPRESPPLNEEDIIHLMDMGFDRDIAAFALRQFRNVGEAAEYLSTPGGHFPPGLRLEPSLQPIIPDVDAPQLFIQVAPRGPQDDSRVSTEAEEDSTSNASAGAAAPIIVPLKELKIEEDISISQACIELMPLCKRLMEAGSDLVFSCADLFINVEPTLDADWKQNELLRNIMGMDVGQMTEKIIGVKEIDQDIVISLATRLHFSCLLFEHLAKDYLKIASEIQLPTLLQKLLKKIEENFDKDLMHEKLLPPTVLWLDLYDKFSRLIERRNLLLDAFGSLETKTLVWKYMGDDEGRYRSNKKWVSYSSANQDLINTAFFDGRNKVTVKKNDKETTIDFAVMAERENGVPKTPVNGELPTNGSSDEVIVSMQRILESEKKSMWTPLQKNDLILTLTNILRKGTVYTRAAWSILSFFVRLTRDKECAELFLREGGIACLIQLKSSCTPCSTTLTSLILRQVVHSDDLFRSIFEKSIRQATVVTAPMEFLGIADTKPKEWNDTLNKMIPIAVHQPEIFAEVMSKTVTMKQGTGGNSELMLMQHMPSKGNRPMTEASDSMKVVVNLLLTEVLIGEWPDEKEAIEDKMRMLSRSAILLLLAELIKSYGCAAPLVTDAKHEGTKILLSLLEKYIASQDKETLRSLKILIAVLAACNHSPKAQESLVSDIKTCLTNIHDTPSNDFGTLHKKLTELCSIVTAMADNPNSQPSRPPATPTNVNPILKLFHKKKICNDLVKTITLLRFNQKESIDTAAEILRTMEVLMRHMNAPTTSPTLDDLIGQAGRRGIGGGRGLDVYSFEELLSQHLDEDQRRRLAAELDGRFLTANAAIHEVHRNLNDLREHVDGLERNLDSVEIIAEQRVDREGEEEGDVDERHVEMEMGEDGERSSADDDEEDEEESDGNDGEGDDGRNGELDNGSQGSVDEADATMEVGDHEEEEEEGHEHEDDGEEDDEHDENESEDDDDDDEDEDEEDAYENDHVFLDERDRYDEIYDFMDPLEPRMEDWEVPQAYINYQRTRERRRPNFEASHPLLVRPQQPEGSLVGTHGLIGYDYPPGGFVLGLQGGPLHLTRQNAIRRIGGGTTRARAMGHGSRMFFERLFEAGGPHIPGFVASAGMNTREMEDQRLRANVPSAMDRLVEGGDLLEPISIRYLGILIATCVTKMAREQLAMEKAAKEKVEEEKRQKEEATRAAAAAATSSTNEEAASAVVVVAPPLAELAQAWSDTQVERPLEEESAAVTAHEEPMDITENNAVHEDPSEAPPTSSAATIASSIPDDDSRSHSPARMDETSPSSTETPMETEQPSAEQPAPPIEEEVVQQPAQEIPEEYRAILGAIVIPEGVDPAFLAALPDDMRAEVLRDHERQQRAQRAAAVPPPAAGNIAAPAVEPVDPEFLNALPPELQEEILQQHERAVREAEEAIRRANEPAVPAQPEMDGAAVIASLPHRERQQVLAEMDETELQRLPQAMQDEARRARVFMANALEPIQRNVIRIGNAYYRGGRGAGRGGQQSTTGGIGGSAGRTHTASQQAVQLVDRESVIILCGLFLIDHRINITRLQKVIRLICSHAPSCDFVIWCLQGFLDKAAEGSNMDADDIVSTGPGWLDSIGVPGIGLGEHCAKISKNGSKVYVNPLIAPSICRNVVDTLHTVARAYPGHFIPTALRTEQLDCRLWPERSSFWQLLQNPTSKNLLGKEPIDNRPPAEQFATCAFTHSFSYFGKKLFKDVSNLQDKLFRVIYTIAQTLPDDTTHRLTLHNDSKMMQEEVKSVIDVLSSSVCGPDGFTDGRSTLLELMRVLSPAVSDIVYDKLCSTIAEIGQKLEPQIQKLVEEMAALPETTADEEPAASTSTTDITGRIVSARLAGEGVVVDGDALGKLKTSSYACAELRLPAMTALTDKHGSQYSLLSSLHTLTRLRDTMRQRKQKKMDDDKKKEEAVTVAATTTAVASSSSSQISPPPGLGSDAAVNVETSTTTTNEGTQTQELPATSSSISTTTAIEKKEAANLKLLNVELSDARLSERLASLDGLWHVVSAALLRLGRASDPHAVLALQPAAEAFFLVHAVPKSSAHDHDHPDNLKMIEFAELHREVLNQVLRQNSQALSQGGPFAFLTQFPKLLDFDVKRKFFRKELTKMDNDREYRRADINVQVRRQHLFSDSFRELYRLRPAEWKKRFYIVFQNEEGQDAGGLLREWFSVITREIFNPNYALFITAPGDMVTYMINKASHVNAEHLDYFKFVGRLIAKAIYDNKLLDCYFTRAFYKHILNVPVRYQDIESEDPAFFKSLEFLLNNPINDLGLDLTFSLEVEEFGARSIRDLKENGRKIEVTDENKHEYVNLVCQMKMTGSIQKQLDAFLTGFYEIIPKSLIAMFNEQELELLISGLPDVDIDDLANNTEYKSYTKTSPQIQWFWRALRSYEPEDRAKFLQFVTGTSKVPLQGFATLEGMNGVQKFSIHMDSRGGDRLPAAHTCFNQLDLPTYESYEKLRDVLLTAIRECTEGFGFA